VSNPVDVIVLTYNRADYLAEMVDALEQRTHWPYRLTAVDNASGPETRQWLRRNRARFHRIIWNRVNEHLAAHQRGIEATTSELFVLSDADLLPHPPTTDGCWLTRLVALAGRHPDFGMIAARLDSVTEARNGRLEPAALVDGELLETPTGMWLALMRRTALRVPFISDGITAYALRRRGYRVGVASGVMCTHLGDRDPQRHPDYLARKRSGLGVTYPAYSELSRSGRPPRLRELAIAAPVLAALERHAIEPADVVELSASRWPVLPAADPRVEACVRGRAVAQARCTYSERPPLHAGGARAVAVACAQRHDERLLADACASAAEWVVLATRETIPLLPAGWSIVDERPGPHPMWWRLAAHASRGRWSRALRHSTVEHREGWLRTLRAACFGDEPAFRVYVLRRTEPLGAATERWRDTATAARPPAWRAPTPSPAQHLCGIATKGLRLVRVERALRNRGDPRTPT
jgi:glycosyltransferase involved in cell wall biosynthesis